MDLFDRNILEVLRTQEPDTFTHIHPKNVRLVFIRARARKFEMKEPCFLP